MNNLRRSNSGVSVIIGALMLTIIVVTAAVSFAVFAADKQERLQSAELAELKRELENIEIVDIVKNSIVFNDSSGNLRNITFTIANRHEGESKISAITLNGNVLNDFEIKRQNGSLEHWTIISGKYAKNETENQTIRIFSNEQVKLHITNLSNSSYYSNDIDRNDAISLKIGTYLTNSFSQTFIPPTAVIKVDKEDDGTVTLDGSLSNHPGDGYIVEWKWEIYHNHSLNISGAYTIKDKNGNFQYDDGIDSILVNDVSNSGWETYPSTGQFAGIYTLNNSGNPFIFKDENSNWIFDSGEYNFTNVSGTNANPENGCIGGLYGLDDAQMPFLFQDMNNDWKCDAEEVVSRDPDQNGNAIPNTGDSGGLFARAVNNNPRLHVWQDNTSGSTNRNWTYDFNETNGNDTCIFPEGEGITIIDGTEGGLLGNDSNNQTFIFRDDGNVNWTYDLDDTIIELDADLDGCDATPEEGNNGGFIAIDDNGAFYVFQTNHSDPLGSNWTYYGDSTNISLDPFRIGINAIPQENDSGGICAFDATPTYDLFTFIDIVGTNWTYNGTTELLETDPDNNGDTLFDKKGQIGGLYALDASKREFTFMDNDHNWEYDDTTDTIICLNPDGKGMNAIPQNNTPGGLFALNNTREPYIFRDTENMGANVSMSYNWLFGVNAARIVHLDPDGDGINAFPKPEDFGGLYALDNGTEDEELKGMINKAPFAFKGVWHEITLTVIDNYGMMGKTTTKFFY